MAQPVSSQTRAGRASQADAQTEAILRQLDRLTQQRPELAAAAGLYRELLPALRAAQATVPPFALDTGVAERKLVSGLPLLVGEDLPLDVDAAEALFLHLCRIVERGPAPGDARSSRPTWAGLFKRRIAPDPLELIPQAEPGDEAARSGAAVRIRHAVEDGELNLAATWEAAAANSWQRVDLVAGSLGLEPGLLRMLAQNSLKPALRAWAQALVKGVDLDAWRRGSCPLCGSPPLLSEIQGKEGARRLRCGMCGAGWYYPRLQCAFCGSEDYQALGHIMVEDEAEKYRLQTCQVCRGYIKMVVTYESIPVDLLAVEDLATLHLDLLADERGYARVPVR